MLPSISSLRNDAKDNSEKSLRKESIAYRKKLENEANQLYREYLNSIEENPIYCPHCGSEKHIRYGTFKKPLFLIAPKYDDLFPEDASIIIKIQRYRCSDCGVTFSVMPSNCRHYLSFGSEDLAYLIKCTNHKLRHLADLFVFRSLRYFRKLRNWFVDLIGHNRPSAEELSCAMDLYEQHRYDKKCASPMAQSP